MGIETGAVRLVAQHLNHYATPGPSMYVCLYGKRKVHSRTGHDGPEGEQKYSATPSLTSALDVMCGQCHALAALLPG
jgi:hypothetical protein